jgi:hypothetical protein
LCAKIAQGEAFLKTQGFDGVIEHGIPFVAVVERYHKRQAPAFAKFKPPPLPKRGRGWFGSFARSGCSVRGWRRLKLAPPQSKRPWRASWLEGCSVALGSGGCSAWFGSVVFTFDA